MTTTTVASSISGLSDSTPRFQTGSFTADGNDTIINVGFAPRMVKIYNMTDAITWEWCEGMAATITLKTLAAGTQTADTNSAIVCATLTNILSGTPAVKLLAAQAVPNTKLIVWAVWG